MKIDLEKLSEEQRKAILEALKKTTLKKPKEADLQKSITIAELKQLLSAEIEFLWRKRLPARMLTLLSSREGLGKTTTALAICKEILSEHFGGYVVWIAAEGVETTISQAEWLRLDQEKRFVIALNRLGGFSFNFANQDDLVWLENILSNHDPVLLTVVDCLSAVSPFDDADQKTGKLLYTLNDICQRKKSAVLVLHHDKKGSAEKKIDKISGTTQILRAARLIFKLEPVPGSSLKRRLEVVKSNLITRIKPLELIKTPNSIIFYEPTQEDEQTARDKAEEFLVALFSHNGPEIPATFVFQQAEYRGISAETLKRVKNGLGIFSKKVGKNWVWFWPLYQGRTLDPLSGNPHGSKDKEECQEEVTKEACQVGQEGQDGQEGFNASLMQSFQKPYLSKDTKEEGQNLNSFLSQKE